ncbi:MAG: hypothetical protein AAB383_04270 [Patescibacteria group bacterium]
MKIKVLCLLSLLLFACEKPQPLLGDVHEHADFKVYLNGEVHDFAQDKYMSTAEHKLSHFTHLHDGDGEIIHKHMSTITLGDFFESLGMKFTEECFNLEGGVSYCTNDENTLKMFVNGKENHDFDDYELSDLDQILITYGNQTGAEIQGQIDSVGDRACIQSALCPERGEPSDESTCLTGEDCVTL